VFKARAPSAFALIVLFSGLLPVRAHSQADSCRELVKGLPIAIPRQIIPVLRNEQLFKPAQFGQNRVTDALEPELRDGKRLRPLITLLAAVAQGADFGKAVELSVIVEGLHQCSIILDDWLDGEHSRRGRAPLYRRMGAEAAMLVVVACQSRVTNYAAAHTTTPTEIWIGELAQEMVESELLQRELLYNRPAQPVYSVDQYYEVASGKSGKLFGASSALTARHFGLPHDVALEWEELGQEMGVSYQILDDFGDAVKIRGAPWRREINFALRLHAEKHGTNPFAPLTKFELGTLWQRQQPFFERRRTQMLDRLDRLRVQHSPLTHDQIAAFDTLEDMVRYVSPDVPQEITARLEELTPWQRWWASLPPISRLFFRY
jgi:hypothetical protein